MTYMRNLNFLFWLAFLFCFTLLIIVLFLCAFIFPILMIPSLQAPTNLSSSSQYNKHVQESVSIILLFLNLPVLLSLLAVL